MIFDFYDCYDFCMTIQIEKKPIIKNSRRRARSHHVKSSYTNESEAIYNVQNGNELKVVNQVDASMDKPINTGKRAKSRNKNKKIIDPK